MTLHDKWRKYLEWSTSPDCFIDWSYYWMISATIGRRCWGGPEHHPLFPNMYTILVAEPGIGKGLTVTKVADCLQHHKFIPPTMGDHKQLSTPEEIERKMLQHADALEAQKNEDELVKSKSNRTADKPLLIPVGSDATTYEALVTALPKSLRRLSYSIFDKTLGKNIPQYYTHSSMCFCLEEISSLFRKNTDSLINFLIRVYDCNDYTYETISRGRDKIRKPCLNLLGGTTPGFMQNVFGDELLNEGFASRTFFIFASRNRKYTLRIPPLTDEQTKCREDILEHIKKLTTLFGNIKYTDEAWDFLELWYQKSQEERPNTNVKLTPYYARKNIHVQKLAMSLHFGENANMNPIGVDVFKKALVILAEAEKAMHLCLGLDHSNPLAKVSTKIEKFIGNGKAAYTKGELLAEFWSSIPLPPKDNLELILEHLQHTNKIIAAREEHPILKQECIFYKPMMRTSEI